jgi:hypothetical protein
MTVYNKSRLKRKLAKGKCQVTFRKMNDEVRKMVATLNSDLIPEDKRPAAVGAADNKDVIRAFDLEAQDWRSFHVSRVDSFTTRVN